jgi:hypothetical protein
MNLHRLRIGEWIAAISGIVLIASLFLPWWRDPGWEQATTWSAWETLAVVDVLLAILGVAAIAVWMITARAVAAAPGIAAETLIMPFAFAMVIVCLVRVLNLPGDLDLPGAVIGAHYGAWIGLAATVGVLAGMLVGMRDERLSDPERPTDQAGVPVDRPLEVETLPGPPPA